MNIYSYFQAVFKDNLVHIQGVSKKSLQLEKSR